MAEPVHPASPDSSFRAVERQEQWRQQYGLERDPFVQNDAVFYPGAQRAQMLEKLAHLTHFGSLALLLTGPLGVGKSCLIERLLQEESGRLRSLQLPLELESSAQLLQWLAKALELQVAPQVSLQQLQHDVVMHCRHLARQGERVLVLVENAESLTSAALQWLEDWVQPMVAAGDLALLMVADTMAAHQLEVALTRPGEPAWWLKLELPALTREELEDYLAMRLRACGWKGKPPLVATDVAKIRVQSGGLPGRVHQVAPAILLAPKSQGGAGTPATASLEPKRAKKPSVHWRWAVIPVLLLLG